MYYINCFFIYSFLGFILEYIISIIKKEEKGSGILYGPWTPIYGIGSILIIFISNLLFDMLDLERWLEVIIVIITITLVLTFIEWIGGVLIEKMFHVIFWDYRKFKFNIGKYVALEISLVWAVGALLVIYVLNPLFEKIIDYIPSYITYLLIVLMLIDFITIFIKKKTHR